MDLTEIVSISSMPGLYKVHANRDNGLIVSSLGEEKKRFVSSRQHMFTPLENITVYTESDSIELKDIFVKIKTEEKNIAPLKGTESSADLRTYFEKIIPNHDKERVYTSDIKKILKWYHMLVSKGMITLKEKSSTPPKPDKKKAEKKTKAE